MIEPLLSTNALKSTAGLSRVKKAIGYSLDGIFVAWRTEHAFRQEVVLFIVGTLAAFWLPVPTIQRLLLVAVLVLVLVVELLNSALEAVVDRISLEIHPLSKKAKDFGSAAVFLTMLLSGITWLVILWPLRPF